MPTPEKEALILRKNKSGLDYLELYQGGRQAIIDSLQLSSLDKKQQYFLELLLDPRRAEDSLNVIARDAGLTSSQANDLLRNATFAKAQALGMSRMAQRLPEVVDDLTAKSIDEKIECPTCFGQSFINGSSCSNCNGFGQVMRYSDLDRQKIVLEATGIIKKGTTGVNINMQQNVGVIQPSSFFSKFVKDSDTAAYDTDPIDVEVVKNGE